jgi:hypothetical protein
MNRVFSNGPSRDFVFNPFSSLITKAKHVQLAAPYFTDFDEIVGSARAGTSIQLLIGLNSATSPKAVAATLGVPNLAVRYLTSRFHAKIFIFDNEALIGSANLTDGGLRANREAVIHLGRAEDMDSVDEIRALFLELWESAPVLTPLICAKFESAWRGNRPKGPDPDEQIEAAIGVAEPVNIRVGSERKTHERLFLDALQRQVYEQYLPAFNEVGALLEGEGLRRPELAHFGLQHEINRFLNWVRLTHVIGDDAWRAAPLLESAARRTLILSLGAEWKHTENSRVTSEYVSWLEAVLNVFSSAASIRESSKEMLESGLMSLHAFSEQSRFVKGGAKNLPAAFWESNVQNEVKVKSNLAYLVHGQGDFVERLHDVMYAAEAKIGLFGKFCALELVGTVNPGVCPPMNGRTAKALRFLGFDVVAY